MKCPKCKENMSYEVYLDGNYWYCWDCKKIVYSKPPKIKAEPYRQELVNWNESKTHP